MGLTDDVRTHCAQVAAAARSVRIDHVALEAFAGAPEATLDPQLHHVEGPPEDVARYLLTLDTINFGSGWFPTLRKRPGHSGYATVAASLADRVREEGPWSNAALRGLDTATIADTLGQARDHELMSLYAQPCLGCSGPRESRQIKPSVLTKIEKAQRGADGVAGREGPTGPTGPAGTAGAPGSQAPGSQAPGDAIFGENSNGSEPEPAEGYVTAATSPGTLDPDDQQETLRPGVYLVTAQTTYTVNQAAGVTWALSCQIIDATTDSAYPTGTSTAETQGGDTTLTMQTFIDLSSTTTLSIACNLPILESGTPPSQSSVVSSLYNPTLAAVEYANYNWVDYGGHDSGPPTVICNIDCSD